MLNWNKNKYWITLWVILGVISLVSSYHEEKQEQKAQAMIQKMMSMEDPTELTSNGTFEHSAAFEKAAKDLGMDAELKLLEAGINGL